MTQTAAETRSETAGGSDPESLFVSAPDGLRLHVRGYGRRLERHLPVVCLPGLARTGADFHALALALTTDPERPRAVFALDYRGRGKSDYDPKPANYNLGVELADVQAVLTVLGIARAVFVGTSRGGLLSMLLAPVRPTAIAGCVLNDIGPVIELKGLMRIKSYVGKLPQAASFPEAAEVLRRLFGSQFPDWNDDDWVAYARLTFKEVGEQIVPDYDPKLALNLQGITPDQPVPALWKEFDALAEVPVMVIRGGNSDLLAEATVEQMRARRNSLDVVEVPGEGHVPRLSAPALIRRIAAFVASCDPIPLG